MSQTDTPIGLILSSEERGPAEMLAVGRAAVERGFDQIALSDHFHPWVGAQGQSPFVWSVLGGLAATCPGVRLGTAVTCPTMRIHPALVAQASATTALMADGGFFLGVGSGENLNEHITGHRWPPTSQRLEMLEEAVVIMRELWTGDEVTHIGAHHRVENARLYSCPDEPPPVMVSAYGPKAAEVAARIGDGMVTTSPDAETIRAYRDNGGQGPVLACAKVRWAPDRDEARSEIHRLWPNSGLPGELSQELRTPVHFEQACAMVDEEAAAGSMPAGPDPEEHAESLRSYLDAGADQIFIQHIGDGQIEMLEAYRDEVLPRL